MSPDRFADYVEALGVEPLDPAFTAEHLSVLLRVSRQAIKKVLMDQRVLAGVGNIYANEALWRAGSIRRARPAPPAKVRPRDAIVDALNRSLRGTSFRDYRDAKRCA